MISLVGWIQGCWILFQHFCPLEVQLAFVLVDDFSEIVDICIHCSRNLLSTLWIFNET